PVLQLNVWVLSYTAKLELLPFLASECSSFCWLHNFCLIAALRLADRLLRLWELGRGRCCCSDRPCRSFAVFIGLLPLLDKGASRFGHQCAGSYSLLLTCLHCSSLTCEH